MHPPTGGSGIVTLPRVHLVTFSYNRGGGQREGVRGGFSPAQPVGSAFRQLYWLCSQASAVIFFPFATGSEIYA